MALQEPDVRLVAPAPRSVHKWGWVTSPCLGDRHDLPAFPAVHTASKVSLHRQGLIILCSSD